MSAPALGPIHDALRRGAWLEARAACADALAIDARHAGLHHALGMAHCGEGEFAAAIAPLEAALALEPESVARARNLGAVYARLSRWRDAWRVLAPVADRLDETAQAVFLAAALEVGEAGSAVALLEARCPPAASSNRDLLCDYGRALCGLSRFKDAAPVLARCLEGPEPLDRAHDALATACTLGGHGDLALAHATAYVERHPESGYAHLRLAIALSLRGRLDASRVARLRAVALGIDRPCDWTSVMHMMLCDTHEDGRRIAQVGAQALQGIPPRPRPASRAHPDGRLRIGYLSPEFAAPPGSYFLDPLLLAHDRSRFEVFLYDTRRLMPDELSDRARLGEHLRDVGWLEDDAIVDLIRADGIDVLVELSAHFPDSRIPVLARRAAPVQATLPQCPATTGCREVDFMLTDRWTSPSGTAADYVETLHYLPSGHVIYTPPETCPERRPPPTLTDGIVTFGLVQRFAKIGADVWDGVADVLRATPQSRLLLHNGDGELERSDSLTRTYLREQLETRGVDADRLRLVGPLPHAEHLELVSAIDVALDTWPYSGTTTTCECLWMGVPVVTLAGRTHASRVSAGILRRMGLDALVASDVPEYVAIATRLAGDRVQLAAWRTALRELMIARGLADGRALASAIEAAYTQWARPAATRV